MKFEITELRNSNVWSLYRMRDRIMVAPDYQRQSEIWTTDNRQLLIDTIFNDFDIPKLYLHKFLEPHKKDGKSFDYAIVDGKQRLEAIWAFIDGDIALAEDFEYLRDPKIKAGNMKYSEIGKAFPDLKVHFDSFMLNVVCIETDEIEMIEEMFSRLNEAAPLAAPEKRNAFGGPVPVAIRSLAVEPFFKSKLPFPNKRYRHLDVATKFLLTEDRGKVADTKKVYLDGFVKEHEKEPRTKVVPALKTAKENVGRMEKVFVQKDSLLRQVGMVILYYHLFRLANIQEWTEKITRKSLADFENLREINRKKAEIDVTKADYDLLEFSRYAQSPNDAYAIKFRLSILLKRAFGKNVSIENL
jgi:Protein of unknown function DUF262